MGSNGPAPPFDPVKVFGLREETPRVEPGVIVAERITAGSVPIPSGRPLDAIRPAASCDGPDNPHLSAEDKRGTAGRAVASAAGAVMSGRRRLSEFAEEWRPAIVWEVPQLKRLLKATEPEWWRFLRPAEVELFAGVPGFPPADWRPDA